MSDKIERYRRILAVDPGSRVFVELAKALLDAGRPDEAADVCRQGVEHHPDSVEGEVLWGRALLEGLDIHRAMDHFEAAIAIDPENPYPYNLVGVALLERDHARTAVPILEKAAALQPGDAEVAQRLAYAERRAAERTPARRPSRREAPAQREAERPPDVAAAQAPPSEAAAAPSEAPSAAMTPADPATGEAAAAAAGAGDEEDGLRWPWEEEAPATGTPGEAPERPEGGVAVQRWIAEIDEEAGLEPEGAPAPSRRAPPPVVDFEPETQTDAPPAAADLGEAPPSAGAALPEEDAPGWESDDLSVEIELPGPASAAGAEEATADASASGPPPLPPEGARPPPLPSRKAPTRILGLDLPPAPETEAAAQAASPQTGGDPRRAAEAWERSLRAEAAAKPAEAPGFFRRNRRWVVAGGLLVVVLATAAAVANAALEASREDTIRRRLAEAGNGFARATYVSYLAAQEALDEVLELAPHHPAALARTAELQAVVWAELDPDPARRERALAALREARDSDAPEDALLDARWHLAAPEARDEVAEAVAAAVAAQPGSAVLQYLAGREALRVGDAEAATEHFEAALAATPGHVRTVMALGDQFAARGQWAQARQYYDNVRSNVPAHVLARLGGARTRLELGEDLETAGRLIEAVAETEPLAPAERLALDEVVARRHELKGEPELAARTLAAALARHPDRTDLALRLGTLEHAAFRLPQALEAVRVGLEAAPEDVALRELQGRILVDWSRYRDVLERLGPASTERPLALVRGIAAYHAGEGGLAREAFEATRNDAGRLPGDAVVYLGLLDLAGGAPTRAKQVLDKVRKARGDDPLILWALGRWSLTTGAHKRAVRLLRQAAALDPRAYRALGDLARAERLLGWKEKALEDAGRAVQVNPFFLEGQVLLGEVHLALGEPGAAREAFGRAIDQGPTDDALRGDALALLALGRAEEAEARAREALSRDGTDPHNRQALGRALLARGQTKAAVTQLAKARRGAPDDPAILTDLGDAWLARGGRSAAGRARSYYEEALEADAGHARARWGLGRAELALGDSGAMADLQRAVRGLEDADDRAAAWRDLAEAWRTVPARPRLDEARVAAWEAVKVRDTAENREFVARILDEEGKTDLARVHLEKATTLDPGRGSAWALLAEVLSKAGDEEAAAAAREKAKRLAANR